MFILAISHAHHFPYDRQIRTHTRALYTLREDTQPVIYMYTLPTTPSTQSAALPGPSCELCTAGYVSASGTAKVLTQQFRHSPPVSSYMPRNQNLYGCLPSLRHLGNTKLPSFAVAWPANLQSCYTLQLHSNV